MVGVDWTDRRLLFVREPPRAPSERRGGWLHAWHEVVVSWRLLRSLPQALTFLVAYWCYIDGVDTIVLEEDVALANLALDS